MTDDWTARLLNQKGSMNEAILDEWRERMLGGMSDELSSELREIEKSMKRKMKAAHASTQAGGGAGWQPIATIPAREDVLVGVYVGPRWSWWVASWEGLASDLGCDGEYGDKPTHWMPQPAMPTRTWREMLIEMMKEAE